MKIVDRKAMIRPVNFFQFPAGFFPDMLTFTGDCKKILVANEGRPGKDINNVFIDPEGSITVIERERSGSPPSERLVQFTGQNQRSYQNPGQSVVKVATHPSSSN